MAIDWNQYTEDKSLLRLHREFGKMLARRGKTPEADIPAIELLGAKCLQAVDNGHTCLDLETWVKVPDALVKNPSDKSPCPVTEWEEILQRTPGLVSDKESQSCPLYYDKEHHLLYLQKYFVAEQRIANFVKSHQGIMSGRKVSEALKKEINKLSKLFKGKAFDTDLQQQAIAMAFTQKFSILTGGPGTGKTTTLASFLKLELTRNPECRIALTAPTGKASVQMTDALVAELNNGNIQVDSEMKGKLQKLQATTIHRLLGVYGDGSASRFNQDNPLPYDLVVVDEASMVSLRLMEALFDALSANCRLLLLGDQNQLASVEAGSVLGDFCSHCKSLKLGTDITRLSENHRLAKENPALKDFLVAMAPSVGECDPTAMAPMVDALYNKSNALFQAQEVTYLGKTLKQRQDDVKKLLVSTIDEMLKGLKLPDYFQKYFGAAMPQQGISFNMDEWAKLKRVPEDYTLENKASQLPLALAWFYLERFRIIAAVHDGLLGDHSLNALMAGILNKREGSDGVPIIIRRNDSETGLTNGDVGIFWNKRVYFPKWELNPGGREMIFNCCRSYLPQQLPEYDLAYAITIHKSQGSGYENVLMILPEEDNRIITRELLYTGLSRTRRNCRVWSPRTVFENGLGRPTLRWSGLSYSL